MEQIVSGQIWHSLHEVRFGPLGLTNRATYIRLSNGDIWVHSPVPLSEANREQLAEIGTVRYVVAPNKTHHLFFSQFLDQFPTARGFLAPGLAEKIPELMGIDELDPATHKLWSNDLEAVFIEGLPVINETVWFHRESRTLFATDLLFSFSPRSFGLVQIVAQLLGVYDKVAMSRTMRLMVKSQAAFKRSIEEMLAWPVERIVLAHDQIIEDNARAKFVEAFGWLGPDSD